MFAHERRGIRRRDPLQGADRLRTSDITQRHRHVAHEPLAPRPLDRTAIKPHLERGVIDIQEGQQGRGIPVLPRAEASLARLGRAAADDRENLMPYLVDCCHAYATVGEMVATLRAYWGDFQEPVRL